MDANCIFGEFGDTATAIRMMIADYLVAVKKLELEYLSLCKCKCKTMTKSTAGMDTEFRSE